MPTQIDGPPLFGRGSMNFNSIVATNPYQLSTICSNEEFFQKQLRFKLEVQH